MAETTSPFSIPSELIPADAPRGVLTRPGGGRSVWFLGNYMEYHLEDEASTGYGAVVECWIRRGEEPPLHIHTFEDELFYVLEGDVTFYVGDDVLAATAGSSVFLPRRVPHSFSVSKESGHAKLLLYWFPANRMRRLFDDFGEPAGARELGPQVPFPQDGGDVFWERYGVTVVGPGPSVVEDAPDA